MVREELHRSEYADFYKNYIHTIPGNTSVSEVFSFGSNQVIALFSTLSDEQMEYAYAEGKWTLKELLLHIIDSERIFAYRALRFARNDTTELPGFEQDDYVPASNANKRSKASLLEEYTSVRAASETLFNSFSNDDLLKKGIANGAEVSIRALAFIMVGHELHHLQVVKERYL